MVVLLFTRCAQVLPLNGGKRDTQAPKLLKSIPENATLNFTAKSIEFTFDEFVQVKDVANQLVVTPQTKEQPLVEARGKKVIVKFNETLAPNTTYRLFFGNAIMDMHENNIFSNFEYVFSTGSVIDSLKLRGVVTNAFNLKTEKDVTIGMYLENTDDSLITKSKPLYFTKTNGSGFYQLSFLPKSKFKMIAFEDKNKNLIFDLGEEGIGFNNEIVETGKDSLINFRIFKEEPKKLFLKKAFSPIYGKAIIAYNRDSKNIVSAYYPNQSRLITSDEAEVNDTCTVYYHSVFDTLKLIVQHSDDFKSDTVSLFLQSKDRFEKSVKEHKVILDAEVKGTKSNKLDYFGRLALLFNNWVDTTNFNVANLVLTQKLDTIKKKIACKIDPVTINEVIILDKLVPGAEYELQLNKGAFRSMVGVENDSTKLVFKTTEPDDYASLALKLLLPKKENYVVQLLNENDKVIAEQFTELSIASSAEKTFLFKNLVPGNYFVKVIEDNNKNKKWDSGVFVQKKQPEIIYFNTTAIKLLANWDSEIEWIVK